MYSYIHIHVELYICMYVCMYVCMYASMYIIYICVYIYIYRLLCIYVYIVSMYRRRDQGFSRLQVVIAAQNATYRGVYKMRKTLVSGPTPNPNPKAHTCTDMS